MLSHPQEQERSFSRWNLSDGLSSGSGGGGGGEEKRVLVPPGGVNLRSVLGNDLALIAMRSFLSADSLVLYVLVNSDTRPWFLYAAFHLSVFFSWS